MVILILALWREDGEIKLMFRKSKPIFSLFVLMLSKPWTERASLINLAPCFGGVIVNFMCQLD